MNRYKISYFYLGTGMEGIPDQRPEEIVCARNPDEAIFTYVKKHFNAFSKMTYQEWSKLDSYVKTWGISIKPL